MKTLSQFLNESKEKSFEGYHTMPTQFGMHSVEEIGPDGVTGTSGDDTVNENYQNSDIVHAEDEKKIAPLHKELTDHYQNFSPNHVKHLKRYTTESGALNNNLHAEVAGKDRNNRPFNKDLREFHSDHIKHLDSAMKAHKTPEAMHVYSGTGFSPARYKSPDHKPGDHIKLHLPGYTSTSISKYQAESFSMHDEHHEKHDRHLEDHTHMLKIHVPEGHHGAYVDHHSNNTGEREFVLPRNTKLHVKDKPEIQEHAAAGPLAIWHAHIHQD